MNELVFALRICAHGNSSAGTSSGSIGTWAAWAAALVALVAAGAAIWNAWRERRESNRLSELAYRRAQLNEFYAPLLMWRAASKELRTILPSEDEDGSGKRWRLVDHIQDVKSGQHPERLAAVQEILRIGKRVDKLLVDKAGLCWQIPPPPSFATALAHSALLHLYWELGRNQPEQNRIPFPEPEFDNDINYAVTQLKDRIKELGGSAPESRETPKNETAPIASGK